ncbi:MAG: methyltransferase domain-containing protein [Nitrospinaceae bacterium]|nr:methyltransferase domain-containing protein [Nitrospinaceae bacterium]NIR55460.1 methyltransferase domain-containing protein [Nitrospinaceae bacterium]NIS85900.1 methyltransferase domain-containing protein [Nitrospinaceae bacterium]NIT82744.1 methyltransferase domain-containing protein [Nitrospinaceae bacterium]NIU44953.1 methyltransferase domain-containing protein [Nitrospinaceae bacterium]
MSEEKRDGYEQADWQKHYDSNDMGWDLGQVSPPFVRLWEEKSLPPGKWIIPGCGRGHEVVYFAERGCEVTGVDFAPGAVALLRQSLTAKKLNATVLHSDFFHLDESHNQAYDGLLEQTFFCAIRPDQREDYVATAHRILKPGGWLAALFYATGEAGGPPFNTSDEDVKNHFSGKFEILRLEKCAFSAEQRRDKEWLALMRKK